MNLSLSASRVAILVGDFDRSPAYAGLADALVAAHRRRPDRPRHPVAQRARAHRGTGRLAHHGDPRLRRAPRQRVRRGPPRCRDLHPGPGRAGPRARPGTAPPARRRGRHRPQLRGAVGAGRAGERLRRGRGATCRPTSAATATSRPGCPSSSRRSRRRTTPADCRPTRTRSWSRQAPSRRPRSWPRRCTRPGDRVLVESPVYPNATDALRHGGARLVAAPVDPEGWDLDAVAAILRQTSPRLAYLIPDFQNPTGHLMTDTQREEYAGHLRRTPHGGRRRRGPPGAVARGPADAPPVRGVRARRRSPSAARARASGAGCGWAGSAHRTPSWIG